MTSWQQTILATAVSGAAALAASCSGGTAGSDQSGATAASAVSSSQTPQTAPQGSTLLGRVLDENGAPLSGCLIRIDGDDKEYAIVSGADGTFDAAVPSGRQTLIVACDSKRYAESRAAIDVPAARTFRQDFSVRLHRPPR